MPYSKILAITCSLSILCACSSVTREGAWDPAFKGGLIGAGVGAGTGAIIAGTMSNGDIAASALLGGGIGLAAGIAAGVIAYNYSDEKESAQYSRQIQVNQAEIAARQRQLTSYRQRVIEESQVDLDTSDPQYLYLGQKLGNPAR